jgi:hypothetical protein
LSEQRFFYADHPTRGWFLIPARWRHAFERNGARLFAAPPDCASVDQPLELSSPPEVSEGGEVKPEGASFGGSSFPEDSIPEEETRHALALEARHPPDPPTVGILVAPDFHGVGEDLRLRTCRSCRRRYAPRRVDSGVCHSCTKAARGRA